MKVLRPSAVFQETLLTKTDKIATAITITPPASDDYLAAVYQDWYPARPTPVFATYWSFAVARQEVYMRRCCGEAAPWTEDSILACNRFTNAYRAADRVSQYLLQEVQYPDDEALSDEDLIFRTLLFKVFNRVSTWKLLDHEVGPITWRGYSFERYDMVLSAALSRGERIFSAAYIMPSGSADFRDARKHRNYLRVIERMMSEGFVHRIATAGSLRAVYGALREYPMIGDFLAFQFAVDLNYSPLLNFSESSFVVAGPGARDGLRKCFSDTGGLSSEELILRMTAQQQTEFARLRLRFPTLWGRPLQPIDCQNLFCEVDKYARLAHPEFSGISGRTRIKQRYQSADAAPLPTPWFPPKWGINASILANNMQVEAEV